MNPQEYSLPDKWHPQAQERFMDRLRGVRHVADRGQWRFEAVQPLLERMSRRHLYVLGRYFGPEDGQGETYDEIGRDLQVSRARVGQIIEQVIYRVINIYLTQVTEAELAERRRRELAALGGTPIEELGLSTRSRNSLHRAGIRTVEQLARWSPEELLLIRHFGDRSLLEVQERLAERGHALRVCYPSA